MSTANLTEFIINELLNGGRIQEKHIYYDKDNQEFLVEYVDKRPDTSKKLQRIGTIGWLDINDEIGVHEWRDTLTGVSMYEIDDGQAQFILNGMNVDRAAIAAFLHQPIKRHWIDSSFVDRNYVIGYLTTKAENEKWFEKINESLQKEKEKID